MPERFTEPEVAVIRRVIRELQRIDATLRMAVVSFSEEHSRIMATQFGTAIACLEELLQRGSWQHESPVAAVSLPPLWPPVPGDLWRDSQGVRWLAQDNGHDDWILVPADGRIEFEWVTSELSSGGKGISWFLARHPRLLLESEGRSYP